MPTILAIIGNVLWPWHASIPCCEELLIGPITIEVVVYLPPPTTVQRITSFFGHPTYYRKYIGMYTEVTRPLYHHINPQFSNMDRGLRHAL